MTKYYYFDIETTGRDSILDKIITIQFQEIDIEKGTPLGTLTILKEWEDESSEKRILEQIKPMILSNVWDFVPVGSHLQFEGKFLSTKFKKYFDIDFSVVDFISRPIIDLGVIGVILNGGQLKGSSIRNFSNKMNSGADVPIWYEQGEYDNIINYIKNETDAYLEIWRKLLKKLPPLFPRVDS
jgi:hypothetical protein